MSKSKIIRAPLRFTLEDYAHCSNCIDMVEYFLSPDTDGQSVHVTLDDIECLARLLYREYNIMGEVIEAPEGSDYVI